VNVYSTPTLEGFPGEHCRTSRWRAAGEIPHAMILSLLFHFISTLTWGFHFLAKGIRLLVSLHGRTGNTFSKLHTAHASFSHSLHSPVFSAIFPALSRERHNPVPPDGRFNRLNGFGYNVEVRLRVVSVLIQRKLLLLVAVKAVG
jgi:hypothetical protein